MLWVVRDQLEDEADVADARTHAGDAPRRGPLRLVEQPCGEVPCDARGVLRAAKGIAGLVEELVRRERGLANELRRLCQSEKPGLHLPVEVGHVVEHRFRGLVDEFR